MTVDFEIAQLEQIPLILNMMEDFYEIDGYEFNRDLNQANLQKLITDTNLGRAYIIKIDEGFVGYIFLTFGFSFEYKGLNAFIDELYLKAAFRGKGIGKTALEFIESEAPKLGINTLYLEVEKHNDTANKLYFNHGFKGKERYLLSKKVM